MKNVLLIVAALWLAACSGSPSEADSGMRSDGSGGTSSGGAEPILGGTTGGTGGNLSQSGGTGNTTSGGTGGVPDGTGGMLGGSGGSTEPVTCDKPASLALPSEVTWTVPAQECMGFGSCSGPAYMRYGTPEEQPKQTPSDPLTYVVATDFATDAVTYSLNAECANVQMGWHTDNWRIRDVTVELYPVDGGFTAVVAEDSTISADPNAGECTTTYQGVGPFTSELADSVLLALDGSFIPCE